MKKLLPTLLLTSAFLFGCAPASAPQTAAPAETPVPTATATAEPAAAELGERLLAEGDLPGAIDTFSRAAEADPTDTAPVRRLIELYAQADGYLNEQISAYETLARMDALEPADTLALCTLYDRAGKIWEKCDLLERAQLLAPQDAQQALLDTLVLDAALLTGAPAETLQTLAALLASGDTDAAAAVVLDDAAYTALASGFPDTLRRYRLDAADGGVLRVEAARTLPGQEAFLVWYLAPDGRACYLGRDADTLSVVTAHWQDGAYDGAFASLYLDGGSGSVFTDRGTLTRDVLTGDVTATAAFGDAAAALSTLWETRTATPSKTYTGSFDKNGHTTAKQQKNVDGILYAYTKDEKAYLCLTASSDEKTYAFGIADISLSPMPVY